MKFETQNHPILEDSQAVTIDSAMAKAHEKVEELLHELREERKPVDNSLPMNLILFWITSTTRTSQTFNMLGQNSLLKPKTRNLMCFFVLKLQEWLEH
jgi:hypothetical protein